MLTAEIVDGMPNRQDVHKGRSGISTCVRYHSEPDKKVCQISRRKSNNEIRTVCFFRTIFFFAAYPWPEMDTIPSKRRDVSV